MCSPAQSPREALVATIRTRELAALQSLGVAAGGRALCSLSRAGTSVPAAKYHEGFAAALAEARRAVQGTSDKGSSAGRAAVLDIRARWREQADTAGRTGPDWTGYLTGGLDALEQLEPWIDDEGRAAREPED